MGLPNLSGSNIQDTYQRVLHTDGNLVHDGTGSALPISFISGNLNTPNGTLILGPSHGFIKAYGGDESWLSISGPSPSSRITSVNTQLKLPDDKGISFGADAHFRIESEEDPDKLIFKTWDHGDFSTVTRLEMDKLGNITSSANISSSGDIYGNTVHVGDSITASGDISAGGNIYASRVHIGTSGGNGLEFLGDNNRIYYDSSNINIAIDDDDILTAKATGINVTGHITASGNIKASGDVIVSGSIRSLSNPDETFIQFGASDGDLNIVNSGGRITLEAQGGIELGSPGTTTVASGSLTVLGTLDAGDVFTSELTNGSLTYCTVGQEIHFGAITGSGGPTPLKLFANEVASLVIGVDGNITTIGNITADGTITGLDILSKNNPSSGLKFNSGSTDVLHNLVVTGSITASGNISSSGTITAASFVGNMDGGSF